MEPVSAFLVKLFLAITVIIGGGPWPDDVPEVRLVGDEVMAQYQPAVCGKYLPVAYFLGEEGVILSDKLKPFDNAQDASILIHELQHFIQSKKKYPQGKRPLRFEEREAYHVQDRFLRLMGEKPAFHEDMINC